MEYLFAILIIIVFWLLTPFLAAIFGIFTLFLYCFLGATLGIQLLVIGLGGLIGNLINIYASAEYLKEGPSLTPGPHHSRISSIGYVVVFIATLFIKYILNYEIETINIWYFLIIFFVLWAILTFFFNSQRTKSFDSLKESVLSYKIVEKYDTDPKWAIYLYFHNGVEEWNKTIPNSFCARDPENDLTFVFFTKEEALRHAQNFFTKAKYIDSNGSDANR